MNSLDVTVRVVDVDALTGDDEARLVELVARTFPGEPSLKGRWYHDTRPTLVILAEARAANELAAVRIVTLRDVHVGDAPLRVAGFGIGVAPAWQGRGLGTLLTRTAIDVVSEPARGVDMALAFLFSSNAERLLCAHGFVPLRANVHYADSRTGARVDEAAPAFARDIKPGAVARVERAGALDLGSGTW